ncbi:uncharacterized protein BYT42DRAFT_609052 [Radiomyces spectabilis]|uniref:uncharacterized protein n=1 Tax=Radiomyces spectabilis TaxID=64574 RepID=UPI00221ED209|nr:uncharacterized protein BYT42DRAFT_609052 [Radiomyces spectabilis]KAI8363965.1 hypothetical protein BYT42DRAFT_609052 [Radiomyces spectabilis]
MKTTDVTNKADNHALEAFLARPDPFSGQPEENPWSWLHAIERIRRGLNTPDHQILLVAGSLLRGPAGSWWDANEDFTTTWDEFKDKFRRQFASQDLHAEWWRQLREKKQTGISISELATFQQELFQRLDLRDEHRKVEIFCAALDTELGLLVDRASPNTYQAAVTLARREEGLHIKYGRQAMPKNLEVNLSKPRRSAYAEPNFTDTMDALTNEFKALRVHMIEQSRQVAERLALDKEAVKQLQEGLRFLHGRKPRNARDKGKAKHDPMVVNLARPASESDESGYSDGSEDTESESETETESKSEESDIGYPYDYKRMDKSTPLMVDVMVKGHRVQAVVDTGASVSVISKPLAKRLGLPFNHDRMAIQMLDETSSGATRMCPNVPVVIQGKRRPEHCTVQDRPSDLLILGMPWLEVYGVKVDPGESKIWLPTKKGSQTVTTIQ